MKNGTCPKCGSETVHSKPAALEMFGGKYDLAYLRFPLRMLAGKEPASDLRDWTAIRAWAEGLKPILAA